MQNHFIVNVLSTKREEILSFFILSNHISQEFLLKWLFLLVKTNYIKYDFLLKIKHKGGNIWV